MLDASVQKRILLEGNYLSKKDLEQAEVEARDSRRTLVEHLLATGAITRDLLGQATAEYLHVPYTDVEAHQPTRELVLRIPETIARKKGVVFVSVGAKKAVVATDRPDQPGLKEELKKLVPGMSLSVTYAPTEAIEACFLHYRKALETRFSAIIQGQRRVAPELLGEIISDALAYRTSDIHIEPQPATAIVRFRVDGLLREAGRLPREQYENLLNLIKVQSRLRMDEHFAAQDGSMRIERGQQVVDIRTSVVPTVEGEKIVLRILAAYIQSLALGDLGLSPRDQEAIETAAAKPFGMMLVTGPTGSGKTTTLYALLQLLNRADVNITTVEDPVEYKMLGVNQIQVNAQTGLTFAKGLRSIVRQDPDVILVGEIRDTETAEIAINAALTGHLLLSTFHANDAMTAIPRLLEMGVEPFLLSSTLNLVVAQRLVRKICDQCKQSVSLSPKSLPLAGAEQYFGTTKRTFYRGKTCEACNFTGYKGRVAIVECLQVTPEMRDLILRRASSQQVWKLARAQGMRSMFDDGIEKVKTGVTTLEELLRIAQPPEAST